MLQVQDVTGFLDQYAPRALAEDWDNVGLLVGRSKDAIQRVMTCLTVTPASVQEALREQAQLIVTHHPLPFRPMKRLTDEQVPGRMLLELIQAGVAIYSPHTAFDSTAQGINQWLAEGLELQEVAPLQPIELADAPASTPENGLLGAGRFGRLAQPTTLDALARKLRTFLRIEGLHRVGQADARVQRVAVACGSAGQFLADALRLGCDTLITGETSFHTCLEAEAEGVGLLLPGHYASERFAVERLAETIQDRFADLQVWASRDEQDPLVWSS